MKIRITKISKIVASLRPSIKVGDEFEVIAKSNIAEQALNNPCYLIYDKTDLPISLYHSEIEEIQETKIEIKPKKTKNEQRPTTN